MPHFFVLSAALAFSGQPGTAEIPRADQVLRIIGGLMSEVRDLELIYEGERLFIGPPSSEPNESGREAVTFQGEYSYRNDGCAALDIFGKPRSNGASVQHTTHELGNDHMIEQRQRNPDAGGISIESRPIPGSLGSLDMPDSPQRILYYWLFQEKVRDGGEPFTVEGWEEIDSHKCLVLGFDPIPQAPASLRWRER